MSTRSAVPVVSLLAALLLLPGMAGAAELLLAYQAKGEKLGTTQLIEVRGGKASVRGSVPGLVAAAGARVWWFKPTPRKVRTIDCECVGNTVGDDYDPAKPPAKCVRNPVANVLAAHDVVSGKVVQLAEPNETIGGEDGGAHWTIEVLGQVDDRVYLADKRFEYVCGGAHGSETAALLAFDLRSGKLVPALPAADAAQALAAGRAQALAAIAAKAEQDGEEVDGDAAPSLAVVALRPRWEAGKPAFSYLYRIDWNYAGSDGAWDSYSRSIWLPAKVVPSAHAKAEAVPAALLTLGFGKGGDASRGGWSRPTEVQHEATARVFAAGKGRATPAAKAAATGKPATPPRAPARPTPSRPGR